MQVGAAEDKSQHAGTPSPSLSVSGEVDHSSPRVVPPGLQLAQEGGKLLGAPLAGLSPSAPLESAIRKGAGVSHSHSSRNLALMTFLESLSSKLLLSKTHLVP